MASFKNSITDKKSSVIIDFSKELGSLESGKQKLLRSIGFFLKREIKKNAMKQKSTVTGHNKFVELSPKYKSLKSKLVGNKKANLILTDTMIESIEIKSSPSKGSLKLEITGANAGKSHNHNTVKTKKSTSPMRRFLPTTKKDRFKKSIMDNVKAIIKGEINDSED